MLDDITLGLKKIFAGPIGSVTYYTKQKSYFVIFIMHYNP